STVIGQSIKNIHKFCGYECVGVNHLGDWGTQFGKPICAYKKWGSKEAIEEKGIKGLTEIYVKFHEEAEKDPSLEDEARAAFSKIEQGDEESLALWKWFIEIGITEFKKIYGLIGADFESWNGESFYFDKADEIVDMLRAKDMLKLDEGAYIVPLDEYDMPPCLILKSDGSTIYATRDIAAAFYRKRTYDFDKCIYVTSAGQSLHFAQFFKVIGLMGEEWAKDLVHVPFGTVSIGGEKLATRTGNVILLEDLFKEATEKTLAIINDKNPDLADKEEVASAVGVGAVIFNDLSNNRIKDINFIMDEVLNFDGNTGPYVQYTYARCCGILEKAGEFTKCGKITEDA
ncbi:MAG: arginine--tRNA ligase, partial [Clostridia bacterium]|nr:arginine--tRNA ligase [Clostridia bacterium]